MIKKPKCPKFAARSDSSRRPNCRLFEKSLRHFKAAFIGIFQILLMLLYLGLGIPGAALATVVRFETPLGSFDVELFDDVTPLTVTNFLNYVNDGDYENSFIHRKVNDFIVQGGGFTFENDLVGNVPEDPPVINEFNLSNVRGTIAMAKLGGDPNSTTSEWFINLADNSENLDN